MKNFIQSCSGILLLVFMTTCQGQINNDRSKDTPVQATEIEDKLANADPYFVESKVITSAYGPSSITRNILQDRKGDIWLASWEGIIRYDGELFTNFTNKEGLRRFHVFTILEDSKGDLWFGTIGAGVYHYDGESFTNYTTKEGLVDDSIGCIYEDKSGNIWFGTVGGASRYDGKTFRNFTTEDGLTSNDINAIVEDRSGKFWFGTRGDACVYDGEKFTRVTNKIWDTFENVRSIIKDKQGHLWLGGSDGLWRYDGILFTNFTTDFVGYIYEDKKGNIWTSSAVSGNANNWVLSRYDENSLFSGKVLATSIRTEENMFFGISEDKVGGIWLGTLNGVCRYDGAFFNCFEKE